VLALSDKVREAVVDHLCGSAAVEVSQVDLTADEIILK
jgi:hypothetical protein